MPKINLRTNTHIQSNWKGIKKNRKEIEDKKNTRCKNEWCYKESALNTYHFYFDIHIILFRPVLGNAANDVPVCLPAWSYDVWLPVRIEEHFHGNWYFVVFGLNGINVCEEQKF